MALKPPAGRDDIRSDDYLILEHRLLEHVSEVIQHAMEAQGVDRAELARRLDRSPARVTQVLGGHNMRLRTVADFFYALDYEVNLTLKPLTKKKFS